MTIERFEELVNEGIEAIPKRFLEKLENVDIIVAEEPTPEQLRKLKIRSDSFLFGLYEGVPKTKRWGYGQVLPDKITIFKNPIEKVARSRQRRGSLEAAEEEIKKVVRDTVWHEIAHHFGMDEKRVKEAESRRIRKKEN